MSTRSNNTLHQFVEAIGDAVALLADSTSTEKQPRVVRVEPLPSLLEQCRAYCERAEAEQEPIRTIHHFACTGGTLISKCLASMPNVQLLSEVDPLSPLAHDAAVKFRPTDLVGLLKFGSRGVDRDLLVEVFRQGIDVVQRDAQKKGMHLVLRDHAHGHFCVGQIESRRPTLVDMLAKNHKVVSLVTVRHPLDSWMSLVSNGWLHFEPTSIDEYAKRYTTFLDSYEGCAVIRYEDFISNPNVEMRTMCDFLDLSFNESFTDVFSAHSLSGDSGRKGEVISARPRREVPDELRSEIAGSQLYQLLCERLGYSYLDE